MKIKKLLRNYLKMKIHAASKDKILESTYKKYISHSMIPKKSYIENLKMILPYQKSSGDVIECGVWKGGMIAGMAEILGPMHHYHLFDSFEGLPPAKEIDGSSAIDWQLDIYSENFYDNCSADEKFAKELFIKLGVPYTIHKGWFEDTVSSFNPINQIDILRLDADWYDSTMICLKKFFPLIRKGGIILIDDYYTWEGCSKAVHDYLSDQKSDARIYSGHGFAYIIK